MSLELVLLVPVLVLLTVFVLWAGRGGQVALTADLAAEEAATAAALCCEEDSGGASGREALVEDVLEARPGLGFLCIGGPRPDAGGASGGFLSEHWLKFEPGRDTGGVGVLGVQFLCETDGAVAPLRGLFPTVTFHGQASEVVVREPRFIVGFDPTRVEVVEGAGTGLVFTVVVEPALGEDVTLTYKVVDRDTTAEPGDFESADFDLNSGVGTVTIPVNADSAQIALTLVDDDFFEGIEELVLELTGADLSSVQLDGDRIQATGLIKDNDPEPFLQIIEPYPEVSEGGVPGQDASEYLVFDVRVGVSSGVEVVDIAQQVSVQVSTVADPAAQGGVCSAWVAPGVACSWADAGTDYEPVDTTLRFESGDDSFTQPVRVKTLDDLSGELTEVVLVELSGESGAAVRQGYGIAGGRILDDEATLSVADVSVLEGDPLPGVPGDRLIFKLTLGTAILADVEVGYELVDDGLSTDQAQRGSVCNGYSVDYGAAPPDPVVTIRPNPLPSVPPVPVDLPVMICDDTWVEPDEDFWLGVQVLSGEAIVEGDGGARGTILNDDTPVIIVGDVTAEEAPAGGTMTFTVNLEEGGSAALLSKAVSVQYVLEQQTPPSARQGVDYAAASGPDLTLEFRPGTAVAQTVTVDLLADYVREDDETFLLRLSDADTSDYLALDEVVATGTITDDPPPELSVSGFSGLEGTTQRFTVSLSDAPAGDTVTVDYAIVGDTGTGWATAPGSSDPADFEPVPASGFLTGTVTFGPGAPCQTSCPVEVSLLRDAINEGAETLRLTLRDPTGAVLLDRDLVAVGVQAYGEGIITNVDAPWLSVDNTSAREGEALTFTVTLCNPIPGEEVAVWFQTRAHSAAAGRDFDALAGTVVFPDALAARQVSEGCGPGVTADAKSLTVPVQTLKDSVDESDEEVHLVLSAQTPASVGLGKKIGVGRIINVSAATVRVSDPTAVEGSPLSFTISLVDNDGDPAVITEPVTVHYATADRSATAGADYTPVPAAPGPCLSDTPPPAGCPSVTFVPADNPTPANPDPANRRHTVSVPTTADRLDEDDETVALVLRLAQGTENAGLGDTEGTGTIEDADPPALRITDASAEEGQPLTFEVTLVDTNGDPTSTSEDVTVLIDTEDGTATAGSDYTAVSRRQLSIPAGRTSLLVPFEVDTVLDDVVEDPETFKVVLSGAANARIDRAVAVGTINPRCVNINPAPGEMADNMPPTITVHHVTVTEGATYFLTVSFSRPLCDDFYLFRQSLTGSAWGTASVPDFWSSSSGAGGESPHYAHESECCRQTLVSFVANDDDLDENDEWYTLRVQWGPSMPPHYQGLGWVTVRVTILDNDDLSRLSVADSSADEGDTMAFTITKDRESGRLVTVQYRTVPASGTATARDDYTEVPWSTVTFRPRRFAYTDFLSGEFRFLPGETVKTFDVATVDDGAGDSGETFQVELRAHPWAYVPLNALIVDGVAVGTILEGDLPELRIHDASADEGATMRLRVELSEPAAQTVTVDYATVERPEGPRAAVEGADYEPVVRRQLEFLAGETVKFAEVVVNPDAVTEVDETFLVELANPNGAALADPSAVGTINGDTTCIDWTVEGAAPPALTVTSPGAGEGDGHITFTVRLSEPVCETASFRAGDTGDPRLSVARPVRDYVSPGAVYVPSLHTEVSFEVELVDDDIAETDEQLYLRIDWVTGRWGASGAFAAGTIFDDDQASLSVGDVSGAEGGFLNFVVSLDRPSDRTVTVHYDTEDASPRSALAGVDYRARSGTAVIAAGELAATVAVFAPQDRLDEDDETFLLQLSDPTGGASLADAGAVAVGTIVDDDELPALSVSDASVGEGGVLVFAVTLDAPSGREVSVGWSVRDGTARAAEGDYLAAASRVVFAAGATRQTVSVQTLADSVVESAETVFLDLGSPSNAATDVGSGRGEIRDVSDRRVSVSDASVVEGGTLAFEVGFSEGPSGRDVVVRYRTRAGTAAAGGDYDDDYESVSQELRIVAGDTSATVLVPTVPDRLDEDNESLELVLSDPQGAVIVAGVASGVIIDDDPLPALSVSDTEASEGVGASAVFTLSLSEASGRRVTVAYDTADGTAKKDDDYTAVSGGSLVIDAGEDQATVDVALVDDDDTERVETFRLEVSGVTNASSDDSVGVATVTDDDGLVQVLVDDPAPVYEGEGVSAVFTVRLSRADATDAVTVMYSTADGTAAAGSDYIAATDEPLTFAAGEEAKTVSVPLVNDDVVEDVETFRLVLSSPSSNAELGDPEASVLVIDDDGLPAVSVADAAAATEGSTASFTATLSRAVPQEVTVDYAAVVDPLAAGEAAATPGQDYTAVSDTLRFAPRATEATVTVPLRQDSFDENTETFWLRLAGPVGATILDGTATGAIADDDPLPELSIGDAGATEGAPVSFEVRMAPASGRTVTVPWATEALPPGAGAASPDADYTAATGTVTLAPGTTTARVEVATLPDDVSESDERFKVHLGTPTNAALDDSTAIGAIRDDDGLPRIFIADTTVSEDAGPAIFTVTLSHPSSRPVTVAYTAADGTAASTGPNLDYAPDQVRTLTIPAAFTVGEISLFIADDDLSEGTETFTITLSNAVNAVIAEGAGTATGTILDDDKSRIAIGDADAYEADGTIEFPVTLSAASSDPVTVRYTTFDGSAVQPDDYTAASGTLTIPAGFTAATIAVTLADDVFVEESESFLIRLSAPTGAEIATAEAVGVILDDDDLPVISLPDFTSFREDAGTIGLRLTLDHASDREVRADYATADHWPTNCDVPYVPASGTVVFGPGSVAEEFEITLVDDQEQCAISFGDQERRRFAVDLSNVENATFGTDLYYDFFTGQLVTHQRTTDAISVSVWDLERLPCVGSTGPAGILEGAGTAVFTPRLNYVSDQDVHFRVFTDATSVATWTEFQQLAASNVDYTALNTILTIPAGSMSTEVAVNIIDDDLVENAEGFRLVARAVENVRHGCLTWLHGGADAWIIDDDAPPQLSVGDLDVAENAGTAAFAVSLDRVSASNITVGYATVDGSATDPVDYTETSGTVQIDAGLTTAFVEVPLIDDTDTEGDETFTLQLSGSSGAGIDDGEATATIRDDDESVELPSLSVADAAGSDNDGTLRLLVTLSEPSSDDVTFRVSTVAVPSLGDRAATPSIESNSFTGDYRPLNGEYEYTIGAGGTETYVQVGLSQYDRTPEFDEMLIVVLHDPVGATLGDASAWATILDDDMPIVTVDDERASEDAGSMSFTVHLHEPGVYPASVRYTTAVSSSAGDAAARPGEDYAHTTGVLRIPVGQTTATVSVPIYGDDIDELDEMFLFELSDAEALEFSDASATGTITDDDPGWVIDDRSVWEDAGSGSEPGSLMVFTVIRDHPSTSAVTLNYTVTGASAMGGDSCTAGVDYITPSGSVTLQPTQTQAEISVTVCYDDIAEGSEILLIELTGVPGRKLTGTGTIVDND